MRGRMNAACVGALAMGLAALSGCSGDPQPVGALADSALTATYSFGTLTADVPGNRIRVRDVASAAEASFRRRGYTVRDARVSDDACRISSSEAGAGNWQATIVSASRRSDGVRVEVHVEPFGDEDRSREVMDDLLGRLGL